MIEEHLRRERRSCIQDVLVCLLWLATLLFFIYPYLLSRIEITNNAHSQYVYFFDIAILVCFIFFIYSNSNIFLNLYCVQKNLTKYIKIKFETNKIKKGIKV